MGSEPVGLGERGRDSSLQTSHIYTSVERCMRMSLTISPIYSKHTKSCVGRALSHSFYLGQVVFYSLFIKVKFPSFVLQFNWKDNRASVLLINDPPLHIMNVGPIKQPTATKKSPLLFLFFFSFVWKVIRKSGLFLEDTTPELSAVAITWTVANSNCNVLQV